MVPVLAVVLVVLTQLTAAPPRFHPGARVHFVPLQATAVNGTPVQVHVVASPEKQVLCTMPLLRPKTDVDPKIVLELPKNGAKIRTIDAPACIERASR